MSFWFYTKMLHNGNIVYIYPLHNPSWMQNKKNFLNNITGLNSKFFFYLTGSHTKVKEPSLLYCFTNSWRENSWIYTFPWCSCYRRRKWTRRHEFKSWTWLFAFHIALIPFGKVWIQLFSLQLWVNSRID